MKFFRENKNNCQPIIFLYNDSASRTLDLGDIRNYIKNKLGDIEVILRPDFINFHLNSKFKDNYAKELAYCKVYEMYKSNIDYEPLPGEIRYEKTLIECPNKKFTGILYDGYKLDRVFQSLIAFGEIDINYLHIVFTNRLFGTYDDKDGRFHARVILCGHPSLISTTGIVEAPAKPKEFYLLKQKYAMLGMEMPPEVIKEKFQGRYIDYDDPRLTEIMKGYVMQSIFFYLFNEPFCENENCRLYNAHWQEEVINAQLKNSDFCKKHEKMINTLKKQISH